MTVSSPSGFWGLVVEPGKKYSQEVPNTFKLTMASLGPQNDTKASRNTLVMKIDDKEDYALCSLTFSKTEQQPLDLVFAQGEQISFQVEGTASIHLTGYYLDDAADNFNDDEDEEEDELYSDEAEEDSQIEYDSEFDSEEFDESCSDQECDVEHGNPRIKRIHSDESEVEDSEEEDDVSEEYDSDEMKSEEEEIKTSPRSVKFDLPEAKKIKESPKQESTTKPAQPQQAGKPTQTQQPAKTAQTQPQQPAKPTQPQAQQPAKANEPQKAAPVKKTLPSGLQIEDLKLGNGAKAVQGKAVLIHYKGTLINGKVFDSSFGKSPLKFKVGKSEVIKGMDMGIIGMSVGGSRKLVIPAPLAYGNQSIPGIPKNSTLIFEIRLEKVL